MYWDIKVAKIKLFNTFYEKFFMLPLQWHLSNTRWRQTLIGSSKGKLKKWSKNVDVETVVLMVSWLVFCQDRVQINVLVNIYKRFPACGGFYLNFESFTFSFETLFPFVHSKQKTLHVLEFCFKILNVFMQFKQWWLSLWALMICWRMTAFLTSSDTNLSRLLRS